MGHAVMCVAARPIQSTATALHRRNASAMTITPLPQAITRVVPLNHEGRRTVRFITLFATVYLVLTGLQKEDFNYSTTAYSQPECVPAFLCPAVVQFRKPAPTALTASGSKPAGLRLASLLHFSRSSSSVWIHARLFICEQISCFVMVSVSGCCSSFGSRGVAIVFCKMLLLCLESNGSEICVVRVIKTRIHVFLWIPKNYSQYFPFGIFI